MTTLDDLVARADRNRSRLPEALAEVKLRIKNAKGSDLDALFTTLTDAEEHKAALTERDSSQPWGFTHYDARFLCSLRDQMLGIEGDAKPITQAQARVLKPIILREPYTTQLALLTTTE